MKITKAEGRDKKINRRKNGMRTSGRSIFVIVAVQVKKADAVKAKRGGK